MDIRVGRQLASLDRSAILGEVQTRGSTKLPSCKSVVVLGDNESGKTTLIAKLQGVEDPKKGSGLEYAYIDVRDEYRDDHTRLSVWVLDGDPSHSHLLRFALSEETFPHTLVMFVVAITTPWGMLDQLQTWASVLQDHIDRLKISSDDMQENRQKYVKKWQDYTEPGDELEQSSPIRRTSRNLEDDGGDIFPLGDGVLTRNLGLDVVVVVTKKRTLITETNISTLSSSGYVDFAFSMVQVYSNVKEDKNCDLLYKYLTHRIYGFPFRTPALVVEKDAVLIPSGWDNMKKISILYENMQSMKPDDYYRDIIVQPALRKPVTRESETQAEDEQAFLTRQLQLLQQGTPSNLRQESPMRSPAGVQKTADRRQSGSPGVQGQLSSPKKIDSTKPGGPGSGEGVLANFFNSLLHKKTGGTTPSKSPAELPNDRPHSVDKAAMRSDAAAELDRLTRNKKAAPPDQNSTDC
uniref:Dynein light intermediate chain n=1 Tax=Timema genevievae TaxID=629358 RepID=A0A7R9K1G1_TIMGE|nr:unnamed protein product [Timema genevievae]